jgi:hypothetical protein
MQPRASRQELQLMTAPSDHGSTLCGLIQTFLSNPLCGDASRIATAGQQETLA